MGLGLSGPPDSPRALLSFLLFSFLPSGVVRASSIFPILSAILLLLGGVCVAASRVYKSKRNIILGAGILFVAAGERQREGEAGHPRTRGCLRVHGRMRLQIQPALSAPWGLEFS